MPAVQRTLWDWADPRPARNRLRPYQRAAVDAIYAGWEKHRTGVVCKPTGTGKTVVAAETIKRWFERPSAPWVLFLAEQRQILRQAVAKISGWTGMLGEVGLEQGEDESGRERIICASRQTLASGNRLDHLIWRHGGPPGMVVLDECHHWKAKGQYADIFAKMPEALVVGLSATPRRADQRAIGQFFKAEFFRYEILDAINDGWLVPTVCPDIRNWDALDISRVSRNRGELNEKELEDALAGVIKDQARAGLEAAGNRKSIWYCGRLETAHAMAEVIRVECGGEKFARVVHGEMVDDEKDAVLDAYKGGEHQHLVNVRICTEGFDDPPTSAVVMTRPYLSTNLFTQVFGRPLRPLAPVDDLATAEERRACIAASVKPNAAIVNFRFIAGKHTVVCPEDILGGKYSPEEKKKAKELREKDDRLTVGEALQLGRDAIEAERRRKAKLAADAQARERAQWGAFNPFGDRPDFDEYGQPFYAVAQEPAEAITEGQYKYLRYGFKVPENEIPKTKKAAGRLIGELKKQKEALL